jgi:hypothetical protein
VRVIADYSASQREVPDHAREVWRILQELQTRFGLDPYQAIVHYGDPAGTQRQAASPRSAIDEYAACGITIAPCWAGKSPFARADHLAAFLVKRLQGGLPGIQFSDRCQDTIRSIKKLRVERLEGKDGKDPREQFLDADKHGFDALSYPLILVPLQGTGADMRDPMTDVERRAIEMGIAVAPLSPDHALRIAQAQQEAREPRIRLR